MKDFSLIDSNNQYNGITVQSFDLDTEIKENTLYVSDFETMVYFYQTYPEKFQKFSICFDEIDATLIDSAASTEYKISNPVTENTQTSSEQFEKFLEKVWNIATQKKKLLFN